MMHLVITKTFANKNKGYQKGVNKFDYAELKTGEYVCSLRSAEDFPELFDGVRLTFKSVGKDDFKEPETTVEV